MHNYIMSLPFPLHKRHRSCTKSAWKRLGVIHPNLDALYNMFIRTTNCNVCNTEFKSRNDRHMDHDHETGKFRFILCRSCNLKMDRKVNKNNKLGLKYIGEWKGFYYVKIHRNNKYAYNIKRKSLVDAIKARDEFLKSEPIYQENLKIKEKNICPELIKIQCSNVLYAEPAPNMSSSTPTALPANESVE